eukprot:TRINITY_DN96648_c0_g1_i1.p1 TRINITY_DN96648_c0_g1~~TRINITY_DN96648_c0_g1_i1.p1  ORF type:complete len:348 (-),score=78.71 TRINITY_DN96648_c0_g1_i1:30-1034(-)
MALVDVFKASLVLLAPGGRSAAMCACEGRSEHLAEWLIAEGVPADVCDDRGRSVLFYAAQASLPQLTSWLLGKQKLQASDTCYNGSTPLALAVSTMHPSAVVVAQQLLEAGARANVADFSGRVPLHEACDAGNDRCVRLLLGLGKSAAACSAVDKKGQTAFSLGRKAGLPDATLQRLSASGSNASAEATAAASQSVPDETPAAPDFEKRELRARKAAVSDEVHGSWSTWRQMRPRRDDIRRMEQEDDIWDRANEDPLFEDMGLGLIEVASEDGQKGVSVAGNEAATTNSRSILGGVRGSFHRFTAWASRGKQSDEARARPLSPVSQNAVDPKLN